ncbi:MAG: 3-oxoacyl-ACP synthase III family protein [Flavobacteriaceae bacterium]
MKVEIIGTGAHIPSREFDNHNFLDHDFYDMEGASIPNENSEIIEKFKSITGIASRRYTTTHKNTSDLAMEAARAAIEDASIDPESLDYIIVAQNVGDLTEISKQPDALPSIASRVKAKLGIKNPKCVAYDIIFGCPGWVEGMIQANAFIKAGMAECCMIIGAETLSRFIDPHDRDSMIYADGAGATIVSKSDSHSGILSHATNTYTAEGEIDYIFMGPTNKKDSEDSTKYIKMFGRKVYEFALTRVPVAMKECMDQANIPIESLKKVFIHQANLKMDDAIVKRFYRLYNKPVPKDILPMNIQTFGNSSVATVPTLLDLVRKENFGGHQLNTGDIILFASVGAGMNINAIAYRV